MIFSIENNHVSVTRRGRVGEDEAKQQWIVNFGGEDESVVESFRVGEAGRSHQRYELTEPLNGQLSRESSAASFVIRRLDF